MVKRRNKKRNMFRKKKKKFKVVNLFLIVILVFIFIAFAEMGNKAVPTGVKSSEEDYIALATEIPKNLKPSTSLGNREEDIIVALFEGLVEVTEEGKIVPALAEGYKISNDGLTYEFLIKKDAKWSNGKAITAKDFEVFFKILFSKSYGFKGTELYSIYGLEEYSEGYGSFNDVAIKAESDNLLKIRLNNKDNDFLNKISMPEYRLRRLEDPLENYKEKFSIINYSGPYKITKINEDNSIILESNESYILERKNNNKFKLIEKSEKEEDLAKYALGKLDLVYNPSLTAFKEGEIKNNTDISKTNKLTFMNINSNGNISKFTDFRKGLYNALNYSLLKSYVITNNLAELDFKEISSSEVEEDKVIKSTIQKENSENLMKISEDRAKMFFANLPKDEKKEISMIVEENFENKKLTEFLVEELKKYDINLKVQLLERDILQEKLKNKEYDIYIDSIDLEKESISKKLEPIKDDLTKEYSLFSLYRSYDLWCKSNKVKIISVDSNNNLILKNIVF
ncbi:MAG: ABC transporter substrate-binding protein [Sarcina sp.]